MIYYLSNILKSVQTIIPIHDLLHPANHPICSLPTHLLQYRLRAFLQVHVVKARYFSFDRLQFLILIQQNSPVQAAAALLLNLFRVQLQRFFVKRTHQLRVSLAILYRICDQLNKDKVEKTRIFRPSSWKRRFRFQDRQVGCNLRLKWNKRVLLLSRRRIQVLVENRHWVLKSERIFRLPLRHCFLSFVKLHIIRNPILLDFLLPDFPVVVNDLGLILPRLNVFVAGLFFNFYWLVKSHIVLHRHGIAFSWGNKIKNLEYLIPREPFVFLNLEHSFQQVRGESCAAWNRQRIFDYIFEESILSNTIIGKLAEEQLIIQHAQRPNICFISIAFLGKYLRGHVDGSSNTGPGHSGSILKKLSKAEIADFKHALMHQNIGRFEVPVDDSLLGDLLEPLGDVFNDESGFLLSDFPISAIPFQISACAVLHNQIDAVSSGDHIVQFDDVGVVEFLHDVDLSLQRRPQVRVFADHALFYFLYCYFQALIRSAFVHASKRTLSQTMPLVVSVVCYFLHDVHSLAQVDFKLQYKDVNANEFIGIKYQLYKQSQQFLHFRLQLYQPIHLDDGLSQQYLFFYHFLHLQVFHLKPSLRFFHIHDDFVFPIFEVSAMAHLGEQSIISCAVVAADVQFQ